jgi:hypothetical protein
MAPSPEGSKSTAACNPAPTQDTNPFHTPPRAPPHPHRLALLTPASPSTPSPACTLRAGPGRLPAPPSHRLPAAAQPRGCAGPPGALQPAAGRVRTCRGTAVRRALLCTYGFWLPECASAYRNAWTGVSRKAPGRAYPGRVERACGTNSGHGGALSGWLCGRPVSSPRCASAAVSPPRRSRRSRSFAALQMLARTALEGAEGLPGSAADAARAEGRALLARSLHAQGRLSEAQSEYLAVRAGGGGREEL